MEKMLLYVKKALLCVLAALVAFFGLSVAFAGPTALHSIGGAFVAAVSVLIPGFEE